MTPSPSGAWLSQFAAGLAGSDPARFESHFMNSKPTVLFVVHSWGGGTIRFACELADLVSDHVTVVWAWGVDNESFHISERGPYFADSSFDLAAGLDAPLSVLNAFGLCRANIVHTIGLQNYIHPLVERLGIPYDVTFTDYHHFSTAPHFEDDTGLFVGDVAVSAIQRTARDNILPLLRNAKRRIAVSADLARRIGPFMPGLPVIPVRIFEAESPINVPVNVNPLADGEVMRVLALGRPHPTKGLATIIEVARRAQQENFPLEIACLGEVDQETAGLLGLQPHVRVLGAYAQEDLTNIVASLKPHLAWFPFNVPETHSYALSDAMRSGLPVLASGIGAVAERVIGRQATWVVPFDGADADTHFRWLKRLYRDRMQTTAAYVPVDHLPPVLERFYPDAYLAPILKSRWPPLRWLHRLMNR